MASITPQKVRNPMKRIKISAVCLSLLATLSVVGCVCPPTSYYSGIHRNYTPGFAACDPCGPIDSGCEVIEFSSNPCAPQVYAPRYKVVDCRVSLTHIGNGVLLIGRGVLDITAAPFVLAGNLLSSGCRYEVLTICDDVPFGHFQHPIVKPCAPACTTGCGTCDGGYTEGIQYNTSAQNRTLLPAPVARRSNAVIQAAYQEPIAPAVRFVQPK
jgi:hypothetical protein